MREQQRLDYLQAMGITQWMPRQPLPNAPQPRWLPADAHPPAPKPHQVGGGGGHMPHPLAAELLHELSGGARSAPVTATVTKAESVVTPTETDSTDSQSVAQAVAESLAPSAQAETAVADLTPPRFELHFVRISPNSVWVVDRADQVERVQAFAWRVLNALQGNSGFMPATISFRWPFIESATDDQSRPVALQALAAQWQFLREQGCQHLITLGGDAREWLSLVGAQPVYSLNSVDDVMGSAVAKRSFWLALQQLPEI